MSRPKLSKKQKVLNLLSKGENVTWKTLRKRFDLTSPTKMIDTLKSEGHCIYTNDTTKGVAYRLGAHLGKSSLLVLHLYLVQNTHTKLKSERGFPISTILYHGVYI